MDPAAAIFPDQERATDTSVPSTARGGRPFEERRELVSDRKRASSDPVSARATGTAITIANMVATSVIAARTRLDISQQPLCLRPGGSSRPGDHAPVFCQSLCVSAADTGSLRNRGTWSEGRQGPRMCCTRAVNLATIIDPHPDDAVALVDRGRTTTYGDLRRQVGSLRAGLVRLGVEPGDRVALMAPNNWFFVVPYLAALGAGAAVVPLNPASTTAELERQIATTGARVAVVGPSGREAFARVDRTRAGLEHVLAPEGTRIEGADTLQDYFDAEPVAAVDRAANDIAALLF